MVLSAISDCGGKRRLWDEKLGCSLRTRGGRVGQKNNSKLPPRLSFRRELKGLGRQANGGSGPAAVRNVKQRPTEQATKQRITLRERTPELTSDDAKINDSRWWDGGGDGNRLWREMGKLGSLAEKIAACQQPNPMFAHVSGGELLKLSSPTHPTQRGTPRIPEAARWWICGSPWSSPSPTRDPSMLASSAAGAVLIGLSLIDRRAA